MKRDLIIRCTYAASIDLVWRAITDSTLLAEWLMENDFRPLVGTRCQFRMGPQPGFNGVIQCEVLEVEPPVRLVYTWDGGGAWGRTTLAWTLEAYAEQTKLTLEHTGFWGFRPFLLSLMMGSGWGKKLNRNVPAILARIASESSRWQGESMKTDYWNVSEEQVIEKTGKPLSHWDKVLDSFGAVSKKSNDVVEHLQATHGVPRYWARTLTTRYLKARG